MKLLSTIFFLSFLCTGIQAQEPTYITLKRSIWLYTKEMGDIKNRIVLPSGTAIPVIRSGDTCRSGIGSTRGLVDCHTITDAYQSSITAMPGMPVMKSGYTLIQSGANAQVVGKLFMIGGLALSLATIGKEDKTLQYVALGVSGLGFFFDLAGSGTIAKGARQLSER